MLLKVPFYNQTSSMNCGPNSLRMVLSYFGENYTLKELETQCNSIEGKGLSTVQIASAAKKLNFNVEFYSNELYFDKELLKLDFYKEFSLNNIEYYDNKIDDAKKLGVKVFEQNLSLDKLLNFVCEKSLPIVLVDKNILYGIENKYLGHFVVIIGFDEENVYLHNSGLKRFQSIMKVSRDVFDKARKVKGTGEDIVIIYKN